MVSNTCYEYRIRAKNGPCLSGWSPTISNSTSCSNPSPPHNLRVTASTATSISIAWNQNGAHTGFEVQRRVNCSGSWITIIHLPAGASSYYNTGLQANTCYQYRIRSKNSSCTSGWSASISRTTSCTTPSVPTNLRVTSSNNNSITIAWNHSGSNLSGFDIQRRVNCTGSWYTIQSLPASSRSYYNAGLQSSTCYQYRIRSKSGSCTSGWSASISRTTSCTTPSVPTNLRATSSNNNSITIAWNHSGSNLSGFDIQRRVNCTGSWYTIQSLPASSRSYYNAGLQSNTCYQYRIRSKSGNCTSGWSASISRTTSCTTPSVPTNLRATSSNNNSITIAWNHSGTNLSGFDIQRRVNCTGNWYTIQSPSASSRSFHNSGLQSNTCYQYRIRSKNGNCSSGWSPTFTRTTSCSNPAAPTSMRVTSSNNNNIWIAWNHNGANISGFELQRRVNCSGNWYTINNPSTGSRSFHNSGLQSNTCYEYRIRAKNGTCTSPWSNYARQTTSGGCTNPSQATNLWGQVTSNWSLVLHWSHNGHNVTGFIIEKRPFCGGGSFSYLASVSASARSYGHNGLSPSTCYEYRVKAMNGTCDSYSAPKQVWTTGGRYSIGVHLLRNGREALEKQIKLYPNPAKDFITLDLQAFDDTHVKHVAVFDMHGKLQVISIKEVRDGLIRLNVKNLNAGMYVVQYALEGEVLRRKFIKR